MSTDQLYKPTTAADLPGLKKGDTFVNQDGSTGKVAYDYKTGEKLKDPVATKPEKVTRPVLYSDPNEPKVITAESEQQIQKRKLDMAQGVISNLNSYYDSLVGEAKVLGEGNLRKTNAISALTGLSGSDEANSSAKITEGETAKDVGRVNKERNIKISEILTGIQTSAAEEARQQRIEARQSEQDRISYREKAQAKAVENLTLLSKSESGATLKGLKETLSDKEYNSLIANVGGEAMASAILFENRPKNSVLGSPQLIGGKMVQAFTTPDGKVMYENVDLPEGVVPDNIKSIEKTDNGIFIINNDGTYSKIAGSGKTYAPGTGTTPGLPGSTSISDFPPEIQSAAQSIFDGKAKLNEFPSKQRLQINQAMAKLYGAEGGNELAQGAYTAIENLETHPGFEGAIGAKSLSSLFGAKKKPMEGTQAAGFIKQLDTLKANIKLVNIKYLKGTGALSDAEGKTLEDAGTSLDPALPESDFKAELARVKAVLLKANNIDTGEKENISSDETALQAGKGTTMMTGPDGQQWEVPNEQVATFKQNGYR